MVRATHQILIDKMDNSQTVLDSDDEMDDIINEFVKTENDVVQLSDESSADEMDSLLDEFAKTQSDSDTDEKKFDINIVLLSDDDKEMEDILEEFREESIPDTSSLLSGKDDPTGSDITESKSVVSDTDNRNGTIFNNTFEILFSEDSVNKSADENVFNSPAKKPCLSSPKLQEFKLCVNLKQEQMDEDEKGNFSHEKDKKDCSKSDLDSKVITSSESIPCKKEVNVNILEETISQNEVYSGSKINNVSNSCDKGPSLNNNASLCNNSGISVNSPINKTNFDTVNQCEKNSTELLQESGPSFSIKIASVQNSEDNNEAVIEDSKQNLIRNLELEENATNASIFKKTADESSLDKNKSLIQAIEDNAANAEEISMPIENGSNLTTENMDLCQAKEEITKCQKIFNGEVSCTGIPTSSDAINCFAPTSETDHATDTLISADRELIKAVKDTIEFIILSCSNIPPINCVNSTINVLESTKKPLENNSIAEQTIQSNKIEKCDISDSEIIGDKEDVLSAEIVPNVPKELTIEDSEKNPEHESNESCLMKSKKRKLETSVHEVHKKRKEDIFNENSLSCKVNLSEEKSNEKLEVEINEKIDQDMLDSSKKIDDSAESMPNEKLEVEINEKMDQDMPDNSEKIHESAEKMCNEKLEVEINEKMDEDMLDNSEKNHESEEKMCNEKLEVKINEKMDQDMLDKLDNSEKMDLEMLNNSKNIDDSAEVMSDEKLDGIIAEKLLKKIQFKSGICEICKKDLNEISLAVYEEFFKEHYEKKFMEKEEEYIIMKEWVKDLKKYFDIFRLQFIECYNSQKALFDKNYKKPLTRTVGVSVVTTLVEKEQYVKSPKVPEVKKTKASIDESSVEDIKKTLTVVPKTEVVKNSGNHLIPYLPNPSPISPNRTQCCSNSLPKEKLLPESGNYKEAEGILQGPCVLLPLNKFLQIVPRRENGTIILPPQAKLVTSFLSNMVTQGSPIEEGLQSSSQLQTNKPVTRLASASDESNSDVKAKPVVNSAKSLTVKQILNAQIKQKQQVYQTHILNPQNVRNSAKHSYVSTQNVQNSAKHPPVSTQNALNCAKHHPPVSTENVPTTLQRGTLSVQPSSSVNPPMKSVLQPSTSKLNSQPSINSLLESTNCLPNKASKVSTKPKKISEKSKDNSDSKQVFPPIPESILHSNTERSLLLPKPVVQVLKKDDGKSVFITWNLSLSKNNSVVSKYQIYSCQVKNKSKTTQGWKKTGDVEPKTLPMACTLRQFESGTVYFFIIRAVDIHQRFGEFSDPVFVHFQ